MNWLAALLLATGVGRHLGYYLVRDEWHAQVWNITAALIITAFLWSIAWRWKSTVLVALWWTFEEIQVITCSALWMHRPWVVKKGEDQCSALIGFDLSSIGLLLIGLILLWTNLRKNKT
jgi:hypothetical protein